MGFMGARGVERERVEYIEWTHKGLPPWVSHSLDWVVVGCPCRLWHTGGADSSRCQCKC